MFLISPFLDSDFGARTTNHLEGWHNGFNKKVKNAHVNIFELITHLKKEEQNFKIQRMLLDGGKRPKPPQKKYREANDRLERLTELLRSEQTSLVEYMRSVAFNLPDCSFN